MLQMRTSERRDLKSCAQKWWWGNVEGLRPNTTPNPLWLGTAVHEALAGWYLPGTERGSHPAETFAQILDGDRKTLVTNEDEEKEWVDSRELGVDMLTRYIEFYGLEPNKFIIATEQEFQVILPRPAVSLFGIETPEVRRWLRYVGTFDGVYRDLDTNEIWLDETKTAASIWHDHLPLDDQAGSYWAVATTILRKKGVLGKNENIAGIMYNFLRKAMGDTRPQNEDGLRMNKPTTKQHYIDAIEEEASRRDLDEIEMPLTGKETMARLQEMCELEGIEAHGDVSASQPPPYFERFPVYRSKGERATMIRRIQDEAIFSEAYREGWLPVTKSPDMMKCRMCSFRRMCELDEQGDAQSVEEFKAAAFHHEEPYAAHTRKSAE